MKEIIIDVNEFQTRAGIIEDGKICELFIERENKKRIVGNIYKGRVVQILKGMGNCFVDIGLEKNGFMKMRDNLSIGSEVIVQIINEPRGNKGAKITENITLAGKYLVLLPYEQEINISKKIVNNRDEIVDKFKKLILEYGAIIRTEARQIDENDILKQYDYLVKKWKYIEKNIENAKVGDVIFEENIVIRDVLRNIFDKKIDRVQVNHLPTYNKMLRYIKRWDESLTTRVVYNDGDLFDPYEASIKGATTKYVELPCGGYLVIEETEALISIDVNSGKNIKANDIEELVFKTNMCAASEIPRQLRLRNLAGIIIIDFIDMRSENNRKLVIEKLQNELNKDRIKNNIISFSELNLVEMTRKRVGKPLSYYFQNDCEYCNGSGKMMSQDIILQNIFNDIKISAEDDDINLIKIYMQNDLKKIFMEIYYDFVVEFLKNKSKKLKISDENIENIIKDRYYIELKKD